MRFISDSTNSLLLLYNLSAVATVHISLNVLVDFNEMHRGAGFMQYVCKVKHIRWSAGL